jgi:putative ABC transport system permease protein
MLLAMAWRNIWRNQRRTLITVLALTLGVTAVVVIHSYRESTYTALISEITAGLVGHLQVHGRGYQADPEIANVVREPALVEAELKSALPDAKPLRRVLGYGLAGVVESSSAALVLGIQPEREREGQGLLIIEQGRDLAAEPAKEAVLGRDLAQQLSAVPNAELVLVGQAADGSLANDRYTIVGIADAGSAEMNGSAVFLHLRDAQEFFGLGKGVHQIIVQLPAAGEDVSLPLASLRGALDLTALEVLSWSDILPELKATMAQKRRAQHLVDLVVILIVGLGVLNAMTMSTFERTRELGVLAALGTRRRRLLGLIVTEALLTGLLGCVAGIAIALAIIYGQGTLSLGGFSSGDMMGVHFPAAIRLGVQCQALVSAAATAFVTVLAGGLWPAIRASRQKPVEAIRHV